MMKSISSSTSLLLYSAALYLGYFLTPVYSQAEWYYDHWCGLEDFEYLLDCDCNKIFPTSFDRDWQCEVPVLSTPPEGYQKDSAYNELNVDITTLAGIITDPDVRLCMVLTKRVKDAETGIVSLYNKHMCVGNESKTEAYETWSSSKIFAMANAAGRLRSNESDCLPLAYGMDGTTVGKHGDTPLGDLATVVCSYDETAGYTSNSLSSYFHDIGWRDRLCDLVQGEWLGAATQTLGGNYGEATPSDLGFAISPPPDHSASSPATGSFSPSLNDCSVDKDPWPTIHDNTISALTEVEMLRRLVMHRDVKESLRFPGTRWEDIQQILYGAASNESALFPGESWGGMTADIGIFMQTALNLPKLIESIDTQGKWRIFSKLGDGFSSTRNKAEIVTNNYACVPSFSDDGTSTGISVATGGLEMSITARGSVPSCTTQALHEVEAKVVDAVNKAVAYAMSEAGLVEI